MYEKKKDLLLLAIASGMLALSPLRVSAQNPTATINDATTPMTTDRLDRTDRVEHNYSNWGWLGLLGLLGLAGLRGAGRVDRRDLDYDRTTGTTTRPRRSDNL